MDVRRAGSAFAPVDEKVAGGDLVFLLKMQFNDIQTVNRLFYVRQVFS